jgi:hypothetical protein
MFRISISVQFLRDLVQRVGLVVTGIGLRVHDCSA